MPENYNRISSRVFVQDNSALGVHTSILLDEVVERESGNTIVLARVLRPAIYPDSPLSDVINTAYDSTREALEAIKTLGFRLPNDRFVVSGLGVIMQQFADIGREPLHLGVRIVTDSHGNTRSANASLLSPYHQKAK